MGQLTNGILDLYCGCLGVLLLLVRPDPQFRSVPTKQNRLMMTVACSMLLCDGAAMCFFSGNAAVFTALSVISSFGFYFIAAYYLRYAAEVLSAWGDKSARLLCRINHVFCGTGFCFWAVDCVWPFYYDVRNHVVTNAALYLVAACPGVISVVLNTTLILVNRKKTTPGDDAMLMLLPMLPFVAYIVRRFVPGLSLQYVLIFASILLNHFRFDAKRDRELENRTREVQTLRLKNTLERVKPHFIYNVLTSIYYLCEKDPPTAQSAVGTFSVFLREALDHAEQNEMIPFGKELALIENYEQLEHLRFGNRFEIVYEIGPDDFSVPPFCVQTLVENAIKHGSRHKTDVVIRILTTETENEYLVEISDNGAGFDPETTELTGKPSGIRNIRELLEFTGRGMLTISSIPGQGTTAVLHIRKQ